MIPILLKLGPITIYSFGLFLTIAFIIASFMFWRQSRIRGLNEEKAIDTFLLTTILCFISARIGYVIFNFSFFSPDPGKIFLIFKYPGLTMEGAIIGGLIAVIVVSFGQNFSVWEIFDVIAVSFLSASIAGFFGCFLGHCLAGPIYQPIFLIITAIVSLIIILYFQSKLRTSVNLAKFNKRPGAIFLSYLIFQSISFLILGNKLFYLIVLLISLIVFIIRYYDLIKIWLNFLKQFLVKLKATLKKGKGTSNTNLPD